MDRLLAIYRMISQAYTNKPVSYLTNMMVLLKSETVYSFHKSLRSDTGKHRQKISSNCTRYITSTYMFQLKAS